MALIISIALQRFSIETEARTSDASVWTYRFPVKEFPVTLNPAHAADPDVDEYLMPQLFRSLARWHKVGRSVHLAPDLLSDVPSLANAEIRDQGKTIVLRLRPHQFWSSGAEITSADIRFGWHIVMDPLSGPWCYRTCDAIRAIRLPNSQTAILRLSRRPSYLSDVLPPVYPHSWPRLGYSSHAAAIRLYEDPSFGYTDSSYWTSGPYQVARYAKGHAVTLMAMRYFRPRPHPDRLVFAFVVTPTPTTSH